MSAESIAIEGHRHTVATGYRLPAGQYVGWLPAAEFISH